MLSSVFSLKTTAIAAVIAAAIGFSSGWWVRDAFCDAAEAKRDLAEAQAKVEQLEKNQAIALAIQTRMAARASELRAENEDLRKAADDISEQFRAQAAKPGARVCDFSDDERRRLRQAIPLPRSRRPADSRAR